MKKWLILAVLIVAAAGWFGRDYVVGLADRTHVFERESEPYRVFQDFATAVVRRQPDAARNLVGTDALREETGRLVRGLQEWIDEVHRISFIREAEVISADGTRADISAAQYFSITPVGTLSVFATMRCTSKYRARLIQTTGSWKVYSFQHSYAMFSCERIR